VLLLVGEKDAAYTAAAAERLATALSQQGVAAEYHLVPGAEHANPYLLYAPGLFDFLDKH
jgi:acetyl esterase/lipase